MTAIQYHTLSMLLCLSLSHTTHEGSFIKHCWEFVSMMNLLGIFITALRIWKSNRGKKSPYDTDIANN